MNEPSKESLEKVERLVEHFTRKSGTREHPDASVAEAVKRGLAHNIDEVKKPLCPCRFYPDKEEEARSQTWICPCSDMKIYKYCHCMLFVDEDGQPITEHLPDDHEARLVYGHVPDPTPHLGRALKHRAEQREIERRETTCVQSVLVESHT